MTTATRQSQDARAEAVRALESEFGSLITRLRQIIVDNAARVSPNMPPAAYRVFTTIVRRKSVTISTLAEELAADKGQVSRTVRELEGLGLVERIPDPEDGRSTLLSPTREGIARLGIARSPQQNLLVDALRDWSDEDIHTLTRLLHALVAGERPEAASEGGP